MMFEIFALTISDCFPYFVWMFFARTYPSLVNGRPMLTLTLGLIPLNLQNLYTGAKSAESTSATNLFQNGSQAWYVPLNLVIVRSGNLAPSAFNGNFWVFYFWGLFSHSQASIPAGLAQNPTVLSYSCVEKLLQLLPQPYWPHSTFRSNVYPRPQHFHLHSRVSLHFHLYKL